MNEMLIAALVGVLGAVAFFLIVNKLRRKESQKTEAQTEYLSGLSYLLSGDQEKALEKFRATVRMDTDYIDAYIKIGDILRDREAAERSIKIHKDLLVRPNLSTEQKISIMKSLALDYQSIKNWTDALRTCDSIFSLDKNNQWALDHQLAIYESMDDWASAIENVRKNPGFLKEVKKTRIAFYRLEQGLSLAKQEKERESRIRFRESIKEDPLFIGPYLELADSYMREERPSAALTVLKKVVDKDIKYPELVFSRLKQVLFELGHFGEMEAFYSELEAKNPELIEAQIGLAEIYEKKGELDRAANACKTALAADPKRTDAKLMLLGIYIKQGQNTAINDIIAELETDFATLGKAYICSVCRYKADGYFHRCPDCKSWNSAV